MSMLLESLDSNLPRWTKHILFWLFYVTILGVLWGSFEDQYGREIAAQLVLLPPKLIAAYISLYVLLPRFVLLRQYLKFILWLIVILVLSGFLQWWLIIYVEQPLLFPEEGYWGPLMFPAKIFKQAIGINSVVVIVLLIKLLKTWYTDQKASQLLAQEKLSAELKFLKSQIHPHFLFNTLNNLYALTLKKSENASEVVLKLSDLLNYMLYECNASLVSLKKEIELVENYISLEKLRYDQRLKVVFNVNGDIKNKEIAPLLILPFVENSFKHGVSGEINLASILIDLEINGNLMRLKIENSKSSNGSSDEHNYKEGIGLNNVRRRLDLLYPTAYEMKTYDTNETYSVELKLKLIEPTKLPENV